MDYMTWGLDKAARHDVWPKNWCTPKTRASMLTNSLVLQFTMCQDVVVLNIATGLCRNTCQCNATFTTTKNW